MPVATSQMDTLPRGSAKPGTTAGAREIPLAPMSETGVHRDMVWLVEENSASVYEHASTRIVFEGLLFNREDLARETGSGPAETDAALVLRAYRLWGEAAVSRIKGLFSFCVWDGRSHTAFCARDPMGHYPLFYTEIPRGLLLSTSIAALARHPAVSPRLNLALIAEYLANMWTNGHETYYEAIRRVPPGHAMIVGPQGRRIYRHWDPAPPERRINWVREDELAQFDELLEQAVGRALRLGPAGILLSGGLDSVTVASAAADISRRMGLPSPWAFSLVFPDPECNEEYTQRQVALALGLPQLLLSLDDAAPPEGFVLSLLQTAQEWPQPTGFVLQAAYRRLAEEASRRGCRLLLSGVGGDEWLTVDTIIAADLLRGLRFLGLVRLAAGLWRSYHISPSRVIRDVFWAYGLWPWFRWLCLRSARATARSLVEKRRRRLVAASIPSWIAPDPMLRATIEERTVADIKDPDPGPDGFYMSERRRALDHPLITRGAEDSFEHARQTGLPEMRPLTDPDVVSFLFRVPPHLLTLGGTSRGLVRQALARRFPHLGFQRQRKVLITRYQTRIILREGRRAWQSMGGATALAELGLVHPGTLGKEVEAILSGEKAREAYRIVDVLALEAWTRSRL